VVVNDGGPDIASALQGTRLVANHAPRTTNVSKIADFERTSQCVLLEVYTCDFEDRDERHKDSSSYNTSRS